LLQSRGSVKLALLIAATGLDEDSASAHLASHGPSLRQALAACDAQLNGPQ
jgi:N-acetylmuramic acid 6-phosphate etherase